MTTTMGFVDVPLYANTPGRPRVGVCRMTVVLGEPERVDGLVQMLVDPADPQLLIDLPERDGCPGDQQVTVGPDVGPVIVGTITCCELCRPR